MTLTRLLCAGLLGSAFIPSAMAHVVIDPGKAAPGAYYTGHFRIGHGCDAAATTSVRVELPQQIISAKPQPKAGWEIRIDRAPLAEPVKGEGGKSITERVTAVTWTGELAADQFDEFGLMMKLPETAGALYFPTVQTCKVGELRWTDIPAAGQAWHDVPHPAPVLELTAAGGADDMAGMDMGQGVTAGSLTINDAHAIARPGPNGAAYFTVENKGAEADRLTGIKGDVAQAVEIHSMSNENGVMQMRPVTGVDIAAGATVSFEPGGYHVMLIGLKSPLKAGDSLALTLVFQKAGEVPLTVKVRAADGGGSDHHDHH